jgi:hypothetical protein
MTPRAWLVVVVLLLLFVTAGILIYGIYFEGWAVPWVNTYETEKTEYNPPPADEDVLVDDRLEDRNPVFDPTVVDRRPVGEKGGWLLNASAAVLRLDVPLIKPDHEPHLLTLYSSYAAAAASDAAGQHVILPSVNTLDGKAKQFDDGLYAALDQAYYQGLQNRLVSHVELIKRLADRTGKDSVAAPFLAAGLELAGVKREVNDTAAKDRFLADFRRNEVASKPIGFYTWNDTLSSCFRFLRFFQKEFVGEELTVPLALAAVLEGDQELLADYRKAVAFYARLTNPSLCLSLADAVGLKERNPIGVARLQVKKKLPRPGIAVFPPSTSRETVLFERLFPLGLPGNVSLMKELVRKIRSGEVDLRPGPDSGWYDHQVYALETLLLPEKGAEKDKLLLTRAYKKRMLEAFQALITKRRETHVWQLGIAAGKAEAAPPPSDVCPRLRVEPCPSYYLRTARAYAFLANFLEAALGQEALSQLHGLKQGGERKMDLRTELGWMRDLFYGAYLVSAEDLGMKPAFAPEEGVDQERCYRLATDWLLQAFADPDLAIDTRVAVPIYVDPRRQATKLWTTLGVRLTPLDVRYARPPHIKPAEGEGEWKPVEEYKLGPSEYLIPVDEFAEVELKGLKVLTREELRALCDREKTKEAIVRALQQ